MIAWASLAASAIALLLAANALRPARAPGLVAVVSFFAAWLTAELAVHHAIAWALAALAFAWGGALAAPAGLASMALFAIAIALLLVAHRRAFGANARVAEALRDLREAPGSSAMSLFAPLPVRHRDVTCARRIVFHREGDVALRLDVHRHRALPTNAPTLVYVHGGGWVIGHRERQGLPLLQHFAARGWTCFSIDYRLSPRATFPDHLVDVKRAIAWIRAHAHEHGADASHITIVGNSAGAHLAALAALTPNDPEYQPGFEDADTTVHACVGLYGVYDLLDRFGHWPHPGMRRLLERHVMKLPRTAREAYAKASPIDRVHRDGPPFLLVHGDRDTLAPVEEARRFHAALRATSRAPAHYVELAGAQHAFEIFPSVRARSVVLGIARFAEHHLGRAPVVPAAAVEVDAVDRPHPVWWVLVIGGLALLATQAFSERVYAAWVENVHALPPRSVMAWIFFACIPIHVYEAAYVYVTARRVGMTRSALAWCVQTFVLGYPSTHLFRKRARTRSPAEARA